MWHDTGTGAWVIPAGLTVQPLGHLENAEGKRRIRNLIEVSGLIDHLVLLKPRAATEDEVLRLHTREYVDRIKDESSKMGGDAGELTPFGPGSYEIALLAAGGCIAAVDAVVDGKVDNAYALVRPPGHHAERDTGRGFCIFANVAIAATHARQVRGLRRVAVVDWDVHHGNGTEHAFYDDPSVLTISIHQDNNYPPNSGAMTDTGSGAGKGYNINVPLPAGSGVGAYVATFERVVAPALRNYRPELIIVASGLDASAMDPLASMMMTSDGYRKLTQVMLGVAHEVCGGRLVMCHEGGYSPAYVPFCGLAIMEELAGVRTELADPLLDLLASFGGQDLQPHQEAVLREAMKLAAGVRPQPERNR
ncbi:MAG: class II histone deacetylase [Actinobacteria bacterium 13_2_20CM_2_66_6]|nr:MAG: class II histone deacetylase [Actinobacteria bacterium 13_2_20CM_2_66_6]